MNNAMGSVRTPVHAQFSASHIALILSVALVLAAFLLITDPSSFTPSAEKLSVNQEQSFYSDLYKSSSEPNQAVIVASASIEQGTVAGASTVLLRGPIEPRGKP